MSNTTPATPRTTGVTPFERKLIALRQSLVLFARGLVGPADAEDLVQSALVKALARRQLIREETSLGAWMRTVIRNLAVDRVRKGILSSRGYAEAVLAQQEPADVPPWERYSIAQVRQALSLLPSQLRRPFEMHHFEGASYREIASDLAVRVSTVGTRILRAKGRLRTILLRSEATLTVVRSGAGRPRAISMAAAAIRRGQSRDDESGEPRRGTRSQQLVAA